MNRYSEINCRKYHRQKKKQEPKGEQNISSSCGTKKEMNRPKRPYNSQHTELPTLTNGKGKIGIEGRLTGHMARKKS